MSHLQGQLFREAGAGPMQISGFTAQQARCGVAVHHEDTIARRIRCSCTCKPVLQEA
jgi:hypothetical protein